MLDLIECDRHPDKIEWTVNYKNAVLEKMYGLPPLDAKEILNEYRGYAERLRPYVIDSSLRVNQAVRNKKNILFEGAQGTLLDLDHGTYPYVTSSNPIAGGACVGAGVGTNYYRSDYWCCQSLHNSCW